MRRAVGSALLVLGTLLPLVPLLGWAVSGRWRYPALLPQETSARGLRVLLDPRSDVLRGLATSAGIGAAVAGLAVLLGLGAGRALGMHEFPGKALVRFVLLAPAIVPTLAVTLGTQVYFIRYGLAGTVAGVVLVQLLPTVPYVTLVLSSAFAGLEPGYEDQARLLGAGAVRTFVSVTLPTVRPALTVAAYLAFLISWSEYVLTLLVGGGAVKTLPLLLFAEIGAADLTVSAAVAVLLVVPPLLLVVLTSRQLTGRSGAVVGMGRL